MPAVSPSDGVGRALHFVDLRQTLCVDAGYFSACGNELLLSFELYNTERGLDVAQVVFETALEYLVIPRAAIRIAVPRVLPDSVKAKPAHAVDGFFCMRSHHTALSS